MTIRIEQPIVGYQVLTPKTEVPEVPVAAPEPTIEHMHENVGRPERLEGVTYKIKTPQSDHALYVTINDIILNPGTSHELRRPFEIFCNSKNMDHFQWVVALTRVISAVFRKGGDITFLAEELKAVFDPQGGYFKPGGRFMPSIVAEIGCALESHLQMIGLLCKEELGQHQQQILAEKRAEFEQRNASSDDGDFPVGATLCGKCFTKAMILLDGCMTCLNCGNSKCG